jgi:hypothetical protein
MTNQHAGLSQALAEQRITDRHQQATHARLARQAQAAIGAQASSQPARDAVPGRRVRRLLVWGAVTLLVALVPLGVMLPVGAAHARVADERAGQAGERTLAREHHATPAAADHAAKLALVRTLAKEHHAVPAPTGQQASGVQPAASSGTRPLLVVVGAASLLVVLAAAATFLRHRARPRRRPDHPLAERDTHAPPPHRQASGRR